MRLKNEESGKCIQSHEEKRKGNLFPAAFLFPVTDKHGEPLLKQRLTGIAERNRRLCCLLFCANTVPALRLNLPFSPMRFLSAEIPFLKRLSG